jgi:hypothetical protein
VLLKRGMRVNSTIPTTTLYVHLPPVVVRLGASLSRRKFYKSMTTFSDHRVWQDVYHAATPVRKSAYIKITLRDAAPLIQFKER